VHIAPAVLNIDTGLAARSGEPDHRFRRLVDAIALGPLRGGPVGAEAREKG